VEPKGVKSNCFGEYMNILKNSIYIN